MFALLREIFSDLLKLTYQLGTAALLLSGFIVCIAIASFICLLITDDLGKASHAALAVLRLEGIGMNESLRSVLELTNLIALGTIGVFFLHSIKRYVQGAARRSASRPIKRSSDSLEYTEFNGPAVPIL